ncbi:uncharacterized protein YALI1_F15387g [Yarrowia lipolytica]|uniref:Uncharacterized protein n=1 Tax=Yarrowia lipolytica TaxID=4952 RepID=A0A1D8NMY2_YARLL|nr:hypothetical protein YALI1_F15387g [Yarrowia lipolytica]
MHDRRSSRRWLVVIGGWWMVVIGYWWLLIDSGFRCATEASAETTGTSAGTGNCTIRHALVSIAYFILVHPSNLKDKAPPSQTRTSPPPSVADSDSVTSICHCFCPKPTLDIEPYLPCLSRSIHA